MAGKPYHVTYNKDSRSPWHVKREGAQRAYSRHKSKNAAIKKGKLVARRQRVGLIVHRKNNTVQYGYACDTTGSRAKMVKNS